MHTFNRRKKKLATIIIIIIIIIIITPASRVLLERLTGSQLVKKFPTFYGTRRFITAFTSARHLSLS
jgi:flagellar basal body-associated protein FliL